MTENVTIIGGGPAGLSAAIYLARANLKPMVFAGSPPGGQLMLTSEVENYPGYESILGAQLIAKMRNQAIKLGAKIIDENVKDIDLVKSNKLVGSIKTKSIIIATGAKALWLGVSGEERLRGRGVSACATCDGFFFRDKTVAVVGGGDTALEEALTLAKFASNVILIHRKNEFRASKIMQDRVKVNPKIHCLMNTEVVEIEGEQRVTGLRVKISPSDKRLLTKPNEELEKIASKLLGLKIEKKDDNSIYGQMCIDGIFVAIGHKPDTGLFKGQVELDEKGYIVTSAKRALDNAKFLINLISKKYPNPNHPIGKLDFGNYLGQLEQLEIRNYNYNFQSVTSVSGVFAAGDCVDSVYRQASTAMGMGVAAALDVERWLDKTISAD